MERLAEIIDELCELRRFRDDIFVSLIYKQYDRKVIQYNDEYISVIFDEVSKLIKENKELKDKLNEKNKPLA